MSPSTRRRLAWTLLAVSTVGLAWSALALVGVVDTQEPPRVESLSWAALWLTALDILATTDVRQQQEDRRA